MLSAKHLLVGLLCSAAGLVVTRMGQATTLPVSWGNSYQYDNGNTPSAASNGWFYFEAHRGSDTRLWYRVFDPYLGYWGGSTNYDTGYEPSIAANSTELVEAHEDGRRNGILWYRPGSIQNNGQITFYSEHSWATGYQPALAMSGSHVVAFYTDGNYNLYYRTGTMSADGTVINWAIGPQYWGRGAQPTVAILPWGSGVKVYEAHESGDSQATLVYHMTTLNADGTLAPSAAVNYDWGYRPALAADDFGASVCEVHSGGPGYQGQLYARAVSPNSGLETAGAIFYDWGTAPAAAIRERIDSYLPGMEVHQGKTSGTLWYKEFSLPW